MLDAVGVYDDTKDGGVLLVFLLDSYRHGDIVELACDALGSDFTCQETFEKLVSLFPELNEQERFNLASYVLNNQEFPFGNIVPSTTTIRDYDYVVENGWFPEDPA